MDWDPTFAYLMIGSWIAFPCIAAAVAARIIGPRSAWAWLRAIPAAAIAMVLVMTVVDDSFFGTDSVSRDVEDLALGALFGAFAYLSVEIVIRRTAVRVRS